MPHAFVVELTPGAEADLRSIHASVFENASREIADRLVETMVERCEALDHFPNRGSIPPELRVLGHDEFRQLVVGTYRIFYAITGPRVRIVPIADGRRDMQGVLLLRLLAVPDQA